MIADVTPLAPIGTGLILLLVVVLGFVAVFVGIWIFVMFLISRLGDWSRLASAGFRAGDRPVSGPRKTRVSGWVGRARYKGCLTLTMSHDGFFLETWKLFAPFHPRLFIPWSAIRGMRERQVMWWNLLACDIGDPRIGVIALPVDQFQPPV
jgi:hypothetical protein